MESCSLNFITEFDILLTILNDTHSLLLYFCPLESFSLLLQRCCGSDTSMTNNRLTNWIKREIESLLTQGEFDEDLQQFVIPETQQALPKHVFF